MNQEQQLLYEKISKQKDKTQDMRMKEYVLRSVIEGLHPNCNEIYNVKRHTLYKLIDEFIEKGHSIGIFFKYIKVIPMDKYMVKYQ